MERPHVSAETAQPTQTDPGSKHSLSPLRKLGQTTARYIRKMSLNVPSTPPESPGLVLGDAAPTADPDHSHLQTTFPPGFAPPPGLPHSQGQPDTSGLRPPPGFPPLPPRGVIFGSQHSPPFRRPGGTHLENCHSLSKTRVYDDTLRCDKCGNDSDFGWFYRCCHDTETRLYESVRDGNTEYFDVYGKMFSHLIKRPDRGPTARSDKLSLLEELTPAQLESLSAPQFAQLLRQRAHVNEQAITDRFGSFGLASSERPYLKNEAQECKQTLCPACGKGMMGEEVSYVDLDGILKGDIPPTVALGYGFRKSGRPVADANIVRNIGLRKVPEKSDKTLQTDQGSQTVQSECDKAEERSVSDAKDEDDSGSKTFTDAPLTPCNTFLNMTDSSEDLLELYTDGSSVEVSRDNPRAQDKASGEK